MSRAFVKEADNDTVELPDRPISPHRNFVTKSGLAEIKAASAASRPPTAQRGTQATRTPLPPPRGKSDIGRRGSEPRKWLNLPPTDPRRPSA